MPVDDELNNVLNRRQMINEGKSISPQFVRVNNNVYLEFKEFTRKQIKEYEKTFNKYDDGRDGFLDLEELKRMMEKLGAPQTHLDLKAMIKEVDEDGDNKISFREFLLIFRKANAGELIEESGLSKLARLTEINVVEVGVNGAKEFFEAKIQEQLRTNKFEDEIRQEQEERRREEEERQQRRTAFKEKAAIFQNGMQQYVTANRHHSMRYHRPRVCSQNLPYMTKGHDAPYRRVRYLEVHDLHDTYGSLSCVVRFALEGYFKQSKYIPRMMWNYSSDIC